MLQETRQVPDPESDITQKLELSDKQLKIIVINLLKVLMEEV